MRADDDEVRAGLLGLVQHLVVDGAEAHHRGDPLGRQPHAGRHLGELRLGLALLLLVEGRRHEFHIGHRHDGAHIDQAERAARTLASSDRLVDGGLGRLDFTEIDGNQDRLEHGFLHTASAKWIRRRIIPRTSISALRHWRKPYP